MRFLPTADGYAGLEAAPFAWIGRRLAAYAVAGLVAGTGFLAFAAVIAMLDTTEVPEPTHPQEPTSTIAPPKDLPAAPIDGYEAIDRALVIAAIRKSDPHLLKGARIYQAASKELIGLAATVSLKGDANGELTVTVSDLQAALNDVYKIPLEQIAWQHKASGKYPPEMTGEMVIGVTSWTAPKQP